MRNQLIDKIIYFINVNLKLKVSYKRIFEKAVQLINSIIIHFKLLTGFYLKALHSFQSSRKSVFKVNVKKECIRLVCRSSTAVVAKKVCQSKT